MRFLRSAARDATRFCLRRAGIIHSGSALALAFYIPSGEKLIFIHPPFTGLLISSSLDGAGGGGGGGSAADRIGERSRILNNPGAIHAGLSPRRRPVVRRSAMRPNAVPPSASRLSLPPLRDNNASRTTGWLPGIARSPSIAADSSVCRTYGDVIKGA